MIIKALATVFMEAIVALVGLIEFVTLPVDLASTLVTVLSYGNWIVGSDVLLIFSGSVLFWLGVRWSFNLAIWVYKLLPLT